MKKLEGNDPCVFVTMGGWMIAFILILFSTLCGNAKKYSSLFMLNQLDTFFII